MQLAKCFLKPDGSRWDKKPPADIPDWKRLPDRARPANGGILKFPDVLARLHDISGANLYVATVVPLAPLLAYAHMARDKAMSEGARPCPLRRAWFRSIGDGLYRCSDLASCSMPDRVLSIPRVEAQRANKIIMDLAENLSNVCIREGSEIEAVAQEPNVSDGLDSRARAGQPTSFSNAAIKKHAKAIEQFYSSEPAAARKQPESSNSLYQLMHHDIPAKSEEFKRKWEESAANIRKSLQPRAMMVTAGVPGVAGVSIPMSFTDLYDIVKAASEVENESESRERFLKSGFKGWINIGAVPRSEHPPPVNGKENERWWCDKFEVIAEEMLSNSWARSGTPLATGILLQFEQYAPAKTMTLVLYRWVVSKPRETCDSEAIEGNLRPQCRLMPYVCVKGVPTWLLLKIGKYEDRSRLLKTANLRAVRASDESGRPKVTLHIESDSESWAKVEQATLEVEDRLEVDSAAQPKCFVTNEKELASWVTACNLGENWFNAKTNRQFCNQSKMLLATTPQMLALQTVLSGQVVERHPPNAYRMGRGAWGHSMQLSQDGGVSHVIGLGYTSQSTERVRDEGSWSVLMRWNPTAILRQQADRDDNQSGDCPHRWALAVNNERILWGMRGSPELLDLKVRQVEPAADNPESPAEAARDVIVEI